MFEWILAIGLMASPLGPTASDDFDSLPDLADHQQDAQAVTQLLTTQYAAWNRHDLDAYLATLWNSPELLFITEGQIFSGWEELHTTLHRYYVDPNSMGSMIPESIRVKITANDEARSVDTWVAKFKTVTLKGTSLSFWRKFKEGWRVTETVSTTTKALN